MSGTVHRTIRLLQRAFELLHVDMPIADIERMGFIVNSAMTVQGRVFHTPEHIFDLADPDNPYMTLAALFHDIVYHHVDDGFVPQIEEIVGPYVREKDGKISLAKGVPADDLAFHGTRSVFGFKPGQTLSPFGGLNEFLSALVMNSLLVKTVSHRTLLITTACIEATIPFRGVDDAGLGPAERLALRIKKTNKDFAMELSELDLVEAVQWAVIFANRDVWNFAEEDVGRFLDNTWKLLPESNPDLRVTGVYTVGSYRTALQKMEGFMRKLDPTHIFHRYQSCPSDAEYDHLLNLATRNIQVGREYLGIKLLTTTILDAMTQISGGDCPMAYIMGEIGADEEGTRLSDHLPPAPSSKRKLDPTILQLLEHGRASESSFDMKNSPLSLFIYKTLGHAAALRLRDESMPYLSGDEAPADYLSRFPKALVKNIAKAYGAMAFTRADALEPLMRGAFPISA